MHRHSMGKRTDGFVIPADLTPPESGTSPPILGTPTFRDGIAGEPSLREPARPVTSSIGRPRLDCAVPALVPTELAESRADVPRSRGYEFTYETVRDGEARLTPPLVNQVRADGGAESVAVDTWIRRISWRVAGGLLISSPG